MWRRSPQNGTLCSRVDTIMFSGGGGGTMEHGMLLKSLRPILRVSFTSGERTEGRGHIWSHAEITTTAIKAEDSFPGQTLLPQEPREPRSKALWSGHLPKTTTQAATQEGDTFKVTAVPRQLVGD
uniref:Uncharacterized protein n=1 Tax=Sphaerodactylus townsendi TaxID=933632 RepID=A0ACB8F729_9SAUR